MSQPPQVKLHRRKAREGGSMRNMGIKRTRTAPLVAQGGHIAVHTGITQRAPDYSED